MTYGEALEYIHSIYWRGSKLGLERTRELLALCGNPEKKLKFVHVAGTNGKGSTCAMLSSILRAEGYRTGLYISPFVVRFNERMQVDGAPIPDDELAEITEWVKPRAESMKELPTEFELITVIAMLFFLRRECDVVVLEVGLGGELDSTNVIPTPLLALIAPLGLEHTRELGPDITDIARAKGGIIKRGGLAIAAPAEHSAAAVLERIAKTRGAELRFIDYSGVRVLDRSVDGFRFEADGREYFTTLLGDFQPRNALLAMTAARALNERGLRVSEEAIERGLREVKWPARMQLLRREPLFLADGGHNPHGIAAVAESLKQIYRRMPITVIMGVMEDKDAAVMVSLLLPLAERFITVTPDNKRAMSAEKLALLVRSMGGNADAAGSVAEAVALAGERDTIAVGSLYMMGEVLKCFGAEG